jgi:hypothetical protein
MQAPGVLELRAQTLLGAFDVLAEADPGQRFAGLFQNVKREAPVAAPVFTPERLACARQPIEVAAFLGLAYQLVDGALPL